MTHTVVTDRTGLNRKNIYTTSNATATQKYMVKKLGVNYK